MKHLSEWYKLIDQEDRIRGIEVTVDKDVCRLLVSTEHYQRHRDNMYVTKCCINIFPVCCYQKYNVFYLYTFFPRRYINISEKILKIPTTWDNTGTTHTNI